TVHGPSCSCTSMQTVNVSGWRAAFDVHCALRRERSLVPVIGFVLVDKPAGPTSHDVVAIARRRLGVKRIGHAGTLDPPASGLVVLGVGPATRLLQYVQRQPKTYEATGVL